MGTFDRFQNASENVVRNSTTITYGELFKRIQHMYARAPGDLAPYFFIGMERPELTTYWMKRPGDDYYAGIVKYKNEWFVWPQNVDFAFAYANASTFEDYLYQLPHFEDKTAAAAVCRLLYE